EERSEIAQSTRAMPIVGMRRAAGPCESHFEPRVRDRRRTEVQRPALRLQVGDSGGHGFQRRAQHVRQAHERDVGVELGELNRTRHSQFGQAGDRSEEREEDLGAEEQETIATLGRHGEEAYELDRIASALFAVDQQGSAQATAVPAGMRNPERSEPARLPSPLAFREALPESPESE